MHVLHVVDSLNPGGLENGIVNVANALQRTGSFKISACCLSDRGSFAEKMPEPDKVYALNKRGGFRPGVVRSLAALLSTLQPDIIHTHNLGPLIYSVLATRDPRRRRMQIVHGEHGMFDKDSLGWKRELQRKLLYRSCHTVHTVSPSLLRAVMEVGLRHPRLCSVRNGVDTDRFSPDPSGKAYAQQRLGLKTGAEPLTAIGIVGRFGAYKGHVSLIEAFEKLDQEFVDDKNTILVVAGDGGALRDEVIARMQASPRRNRIRWLGHCERPEDVFRALDLMVFPSTHEGLSNALLESMACGVPVLAASACGNDEAIEDGVNGWLRSMCSSDLIAEHLQDVLDSPETMSELGVTARRSIATDFSLANMANGYRDIYKSVINQEC